MPAVKQASLFFTLGSSDKEYHCQIVERDGGYSVEFQYGRRGGPLQTGSKTPSPVDLDKATAVFDKLVKEKTGKGYTPGESGVAYQNTDKEAAYTGVLPQLLNPIDKAEAADYLYSPYFFMQEKHDGERVLVRKSGANITGINKKGIERPLPLELVEAALSIDGDMLLDGELLGNRYVAFDLLEADGVDLRRQTYDYRYAALLRRFYGPCGFIEVCNTFASAPEKAHAMRRLEEEGREGVVFKRHDAPYSAGRPNSGGDQLKLKFYATATVQVIAAKGDKRSVRIQGFDDQGQPVEIGSVTIPPNADIPQAGEFIEVRYLYAYPGGSLYQPSFLGKRSDQDASDCRISTLKYKPESDLAQAA
ncbi:MAG: WGR domain-containing protein [Burkholderiaceae bacterium]|nr:WGR domain-containing protein [Burkholderiaceae bacterium]